MAFTRGKLSLFALAGQYKPLVLYGRLAYSLIYNLGSIFTYTSAVDLPKVLYNYISYSECTKGRPKFRYATMISFQVNTTYVVGHVIYAPMVVQSPYTNYIA